MWAFTFAKLWPGYTVYASEYGSTMIFYFNLATLISLLLFGHVLGPILRRFGGEKA